MFLLDIHFSRKVSPKLVFWTGNAPDIRDIDIGKVCNSLTAKHTEAILGWHSFTGCDQTSSPLPHESNVHQKPMKNKVNAEKNPEKTAN